MSQYIRIEMHNEIVERFEQQIKALTAEVARLSAIELAAERACKDLNTQCAFWRRAAKDAVEGWCALEDKIDTVVQKLQAVAVYAAQSEVAEVLALLVEADPLEPPTLELEHALRELPEVDLGDGRKLRVVEEETPIPGAGIVSEEDLARAQASDKDD